MATVAPMPTSERASVNVKTSSFGAEEDVFVSHGNGESTNQKSQQKNESADYQGHKLGNRIVEQNDGRSEGSDFDGRYNGMDYAGSSSLHWKPLDPSSRKQSLSAPSSPETPIPHLPDSSRSLQEIFEVDDLMDSPLLVSEVDEISGNNGATKNTDWYTNPTHASDNSSRHHRTDTPPLSLYASTDATVQSHHESHGTSGSTTSTLAVTPDSAPGVHHRERVDEPMKGTESTTGPSAIGSSKRATGRSPSTPPILYSAIGSLENFSSTTMGSFKKRVQTAKGRDFHHQSDAGKVPKLLPPQNLLPQGGTKKPATSNLHSSLLQKTTGEPPHADSRCTISSANDAPKDRSSEKAMDNEEKKNDSNGYEPSTRPKKISNLKSNRKVASNDHPVTFDPSTKRDSNGKPSTRKKKGKPVEMFRPSCDAYTPRMERKIIAYKPAEMRTPVQKMATPMGTLQRPNFRDALRRVAMIIHQHIVKIERRFDSTAAGNPRGGDGGLFKKSMKEAFDESSYVIPTYRCTMVRIPMARPGMVYGLRKLKLNQNVPSEAEIYEFAHQLFKKVQLSSECSIVCLIYIERLMEIAKVPLLACTWRPIFMCGLLLASKVWQDLSSWNIEFASVYPQFSLDAINKLELNFLRNVKWDLYISSR